MSRLFRFAENDKCRQISLELNSWGLHWGLERERKIHCHKCTFSVKCEIRHFHTAVLQWWQRNEQKSVIVVVLLDKLVAFFDFLIVIPVIVAKAPFISPSPIINIHVFLAMTLENSRGQGGRVCSMHSETLAFLDLNHCFSEVIDEKRHPLPNSRIRVLESIQPCPISITAIIFVIIIPQILGLKGSKTKPYVICSFIKNWIIG